MRSRTQLTDAEVLARCPLFAELADDDLNALAAIASRRQFAAGESLFLAGDRPEGLHVMVAGAVKIFVLSPGSGREIVLTTERPYLAVAELPSFDGGSYPAHAEALGPSETLLLEQGALERLLSEEPRIARHLLGALGRRLRRLVGLIEQLSFQEVIQRLSGHLHERARRGLPFELETNAAMAAQLGTVPELVSRNLARLQQSGALRLERRWVVAVDEALLAELSQRSSR